MVVALGMAGLFLKKSLDTDEPIMVMNRYLSIWGEMVPARDGSRETLLQQQLASSEPRVRWSAARQLAGMGNRAAVPWLIEALNDETGTQRVCVMASSLGSIRDPEAIPTLVKALSHPKNEDLRICAAKALGEIGREDTAQALIHAYQQGRVSVTVFEALGRIGGEEAVVFLESVTTGPVNALAEAKAREALRMIMAEHRSNEPEFLKKLLVTAKGGERLWLVEKLALSDGESAVQILGHLASNPREPDEITGCALAGLVRKGEQGKAELEKLSRHSNRKIRDLASSAVKRMESGPSFR